MKFLFKHEYQWLSQEGNTYRKVDTICIAEDENPFEVVRREGGYLDWICEWVAESIRQGVARDSGHPIELTEISPDLGVGRFTISVVE